MCDYSYNACGSVQSVDLWRERSLNLVKVLKMIYAPLVEASEAVPLVPGVGAALGVEPGFEQLLVLLEEQELA